MLLLDALCMHILLMCQPCTKYKVENINKCSVECWVNSGRDVMNMSKIPEEVPQELYNLFNKKSSNHVYGPLIESSIFDTNGLLLLDRNGTVVGSNDSNDSIDGGARSGNVSGFQLISIQVIYNDDKNLKKPIMFKKARHHSHNVVRSKPAVGHFFFKKGYVCWTHWEKKDYKDALCLLENFQTW